MLFAWLVDEIDNNQDSDQVESVIVNESIMINNYNSTNRTPENNDPATLDKDPLELNSLTDSEVLKDLDLNILDFNDQSFLNDISSNDSGIVLEKPNQVEVTNEFMEVEIVQIVQEPKYFNSGE